MKFLMGLNETHYQIRSQTLAMDPLPNVKEIYNIIRRNEKQQGMQRSNHQNTSTLYVAPNNRNNDNMTVRQQNNPTGNQYQNRPRSEEKGNLFCTHCNLRGHTKETCYKIVGYPPGHKNYKRNSGQHNRNTHYGNNKTLANNVIVENAFTGGNNEMEQMEGQLSLGGVKMSQEQINNLMNLINSMSTKETGPIQWQV